MLVRRVRAEEWPAWRELRLAALRDAPSAFETRYDDDVLLGDEPWIERTADFAAGAERALFIAEDGERWLACAGSYTRVDDSLTRRVISVWTRPEARGRGLAAATVGAVLGWARDAGASRATLWVTEANTGARRLYDRLGFAATGTRQPLSSQPDVTEIEMALELSG